MGGIPIAGDSELTTPTNDLRKMKESMDGENQHERKASQQLQITQVSTSDSNLDIDYKFRIPKPKLKMNTLTGSNSGTASVIDKYNKVMKNLKIKKIKLT